MFREFKSISDLIHAFPDEQACISYLESQLWKDGPVSPFDSSSRVYKCKNNRYKCRSSGKYFTVTTGTIFQYRKMGLQKWFIAIYLFLSDKKGASSYKIARDISVTQGTAWLMLTKIRAAFHMPDVELEGTVEVDESFIGGKMSNKHTVKIKRNKYGGKLLVQQPVLGLMQRGGNVIIRAVSNRKKKNILPVIFSIVKKDSHIITDEYGGYKDLHQEYIHSKINHARNIYVNGDIHTNTIENFWSHLKRGITSTYHQVSKRHLQKYTDEFAFRYNTRKQTIQERFNFALAGMAGKTYTYKRLTA